MAITYEIDADLGLVRTSATGILTNDELIAHKQALISDPDFRPDMRELSDVRAVQRLDVTTEGVLQLVALDKAHAGRLGDYRLALVVAADVVFGMARMYQTLTEENINNMRVFRDTEEALAWLGIGQVSD